MAVLLRMAAHPVRKTLGTEPGRCPVQKMEDAARTEQVQVGTEGMLKVHMAAPVRVIHKPVIERLDLHLVQGTHQEYELALPDEVLMDDGGDGEKQNRSTQEENVVRIRISRDLVQEKDAGGDEKKLGRDHGGLNRPLALEPPLTPFDAGPVGVFG